MAVLDGLCKYIVVGSDTLRDFAASHPSHNFVSYRQRYDQHPGIPFLQSHIREFKQRGESVQQPLLRLFQNITSSQREDNDPVST
ncbi:hypothetical protein N7534_005621 [Penicillium rubens]|nr:hypothetical protein N7534_005621 [Penicillium rubens]